MLKVSDAVKNKLLESESALTSLSHGILNLSAFAKQIQKDIERATLKPVKLGTIVAALARLARDLESLPLIGPPVVLKDIAVKSGLCEIAFEQTESNRLSLQKLYDSKMLSPTDFFTATHGVGEIAIVTSDRHKQLVFDTFANQKPKVVADKLCALTVRFSEHYLETPGQTFWLVRKVAIERINIFEVISTYTELTFLLHERDINRGLAVFTPYLSAV